MEKARKTTEVLTFTHGDQPFLDEWIHFFLGHGVEIFHTDHISPTPEAIEEVPKRKYEGSLRFVIGSKVEEEDTVFLSEEQNQKEEKMVKARRKKAYFLTLCVSLFATYLICLWAPSWEIVGK